LIELGTATRRAVVTFSCILAPLYDPHDGADGRINVSGAPQSQLFQSVLHAFEISPNTPAFIAASSLPRKLNTGIWRD